MIYFLHIFAKKRFRTFFANVANFRKLCKFLHIDYIFARKQGMVLIVIELCPNSLLDNPFCIFLAQICKKKCFCTFLQTSRNFANFCIFAKKSINDINCVATPLNICQFYLLQDFCFPLNHVANFSYCKFHSLPKMKQAL